MSGRLSMQSGRFAAAISQAISARRQAKSAEEQAQTAKEQADSAKKSADTAERQTRAAEEQLALARHQFQHDLAARDEADGPVFEVEPGIAQFVGEQYAVVPMKLVAGKPLSTAILTAAAQPDGAATGVSVPQPQTCSTSCQRPPPGS